MPVRTERSEVRTKTTEGQYSPVRLELARLVCSLLYGTRAMLVLSLPAFENKKYTAYNRFHGNGPYGEMPTKKEPIRTLRFTSTLHCHIIISVVQLIIKLDPISLHLTFNVVPLKITELSFASLHIGFARCHQFTATIPEFFFLFQALGHGTSWVTLKPQWG